MKTFTVYCSRVVNYTFNVKATDETSARQAARDLLDSVSKDDLNTHADYGYIDIDDVKEEY